MIFNFNLGAKITWLQSNPPFQPAPWQPHYHPQRQQGLRILFSLSSSDVLSASTYPNQEMGANPTCQCSLSTGIHQLPGECTVTDPTEAQNMRQWPSQELDPSLSLCLSSCSALCQECLFPAIFQLLRPCFQGQFKCLLQRKATPPSTERGQRDWDVFCAVALQGVALGQGEEERNRTFVCVCVEWEDNVFSGY